jgi:hypothetical protein
MATELDRTFVVFWISVALLTGAFWAGVVMVIARWQ